MALIEAQLRTEFAKEYTALTPGRWYRVNQTAREIDSDTADHIHLETEEKLVEVAVEHVVRRRVGEAEE